MSKLGFAIAIGLIAATAPAAANLVTNGDFSSGATGFATTYSSTISGATSLQGSYGVTTDPALYCSSCFRSIGDHTTGTGNMLFVDGAGANTGYFWSQTFAVTPGADYAFSIWATSVNEHDARAVLLATINGITVLPATTLQYTTGDTATTWLQYTGTWSAGAATSATLQLFDTNIIYDYNDFAIDDISLERVPGAAVPEPASWAMMIGGFALMGGTLRRRSMKTALRFG